MGSQRQASAGVTVRVMVTLLIFLSLLGLQESWQEIKILKLVDVLEDPFLIQEIEDHDQVSSAKRSLASVSRNWRSSFKRIQTPYILPKSRVRSVRNRAPPNPEDVVFYRSYRAGADNPAMVDMRTEALMRGMG